MTMESGRLPKVLAGDGDGAAKAVQENLDQPGGIAAHPFAC